MKYYVVADPHGYYTATIEALTNAGFFDDNNPKKVVVRGNHEDLFLCMLEDILNDPAPFYDFRSYHIRNGTLDTALQLTHWTIADFLTRPRDFVFKTRQTPFVKRLIPASVDYFETTNHIFVHGWIPCHAIMYGMGRKYAPIDKWRSASRNDWNQARWINGMEAAIFGKIVEPNKTIVCGHWHCSYGHSIIDKNGPEHGTDAIREPFYGDSVIGLDACTALSKKVNCIVIEDEES